MLTSKAWRPKRTQGAGKKHELLLGLLVALGIFFASVTVLALLVSRRGMELEQSGTVGRLLYAAAILAGCFLTARRARNAKLLWAAVPAAAACVLVLGTVYAMPGTPNGSVGGLLAWTAAAWLVGSLLGARIKKHGYG